ncbi:MAG: hypothetical protein M5U26_01460 [Planctomycetota bacterium]|nr:hypothetical protein [Planctomycetota bacterium]
MWGEEAPAIDRQSLPWLRQELDRSFTSDTPVSTPPPMMVASFLLLYLLAAVPLNYLLFGWLKRREAAWLAAPGWAVAFVVAAYLVSYKEGKLTVDEVCVIEAGPLQDHGVAHTFLNVYAPNRGSYDLAFGNEAEPASEVQAATGHLISPEFATRGIIDVLPELNLDQTEEGLLVQDLLIQSRATRRLELVHRVPLGGGVTADVKRDAGGYTLKVLNETPYVLLNSALLMRLDDGATWGAPLGHLQAQMPEALERRLPNERQGAAEAGGAGWKDLQEAFFGQPPTFAKARGQWARERARNLSEYVSKRIPRVGDAVLVGWIDGGMLPVRIDDGKAQDRRGFTLLVLPLPRNLGAGPVRAGFKIQFSGNAELDVDAPVWRNLNAGDGVRLSMQTRADAAILLKLDAPEEIQKIGSPVLEASFHLYAETLEDASAGLPDGKKPRQVPSGYDGTPVVEIQELRGGKPRWRPLTGQAPAMSLTPGQRSQDYRVAIELRQTMKDDDGKITLRISVPKLKVTGTVDNEWDHWPLRMQGFKVRVREKGKQEGP